MAQVWLGSSLFVLDVAFTWMTYRPDSPTQLAWAAAIGMISAVPTACGLATTFFGNATSTVLEIPPEEMRAISDS